MGSSLKLRNTHTKNGANSEGHANSITLSPSEEKVGVPAEEYATLLLRQSLTTPTEAELSDSASRMLDRYANLYKRLA